MKKKVRYYSILCLAIALVMCLVQLGTVLSDARASALSDSGQGQTQTTVQDEGVVRPESIDEGLSLKSLKDIQGRRVTVRQPIMEVKDYHVARPKKEDVKILEDTYYLGDFETRKILHKDAKVTFEGEVGDPDSDNPKYPMKGLKNSSKNAEEGQKYFSCFEKYMLLRQAYYFNMNAMKIVAEGKLAKHPAADYIYGAIPDSAEAVKMHIVTDPMYRSPMTTGLYLVPGEKATVKIRGLKTGQTLTFYTHHQDTMGYRGYDEKGNDLGTDKAYFSYWDEKILKIAQDAEGTGRAPVFTDLSYGLHGQWVWQNQKVPCMGTTFTITGDGSAEMEVEIGSMYGGPLYVKPTAESVDFDITGAVLTPHFVLGVTTVEDFKEHYSKAPGLIATMDVENGQLIGPAEDMRNADDIEKLAYFWHSVFAIDISLNGREYNYNMTMCYDMHVPAGEAVALNSNFCAQPTYWFGTCMNYKKLTTNGNWGTLHELGHVQAKTYGVNWGFAEGDGEVWNNTLILIIYSLLCNMDNRLAPVEHGEYVHPYTAIVRSQNITKEYTKDGTTYKIEDYRDINNGDGAHFDQLSMYATLLHSFGPEKFIDMFYTYKLDPEYCGNKRADFVYRIALVDRVNILDWVNGNYFANIPESAFSESQLEFLRSLPTFYPVAYRWANGIDGNETARKYEVDGKHQTVFDLSGDNITSPKSVEIVKVTEAKHGHTQFDETAKKVTYTPPKDVTEYDEFEIVVRTFGGRQVTLNVRFKLLYRGVRTEVWNLGTRDENPLNVKQPNLEQVRAYVKDRDPDSTEIGSVPGKGDFDHKYLEYFRMQFKFVATKEGEHTFFLRADDASEVQFFKDGESAAAGRMFTTSDVQNFGDQNANRMCKITLKKGETLTVKAELVNWGGKGHLHIGLRMPGQENAAIEDIPLENIVNSDVSETELKKADAFTGWQPRFVDSIKDVTMDRKAETGEWQILQAPLCESTNNGSHLIDGNEDTIYHSHYTTNKKPAVPHVFVIDTRKNQNFNFFEVLRRHNGSGNDRLLGYTLYGCTAEAYQESTLQDAEGGAGWTKLYEGAPSDINAARLRLMFPETQLRYFKFVVTANGGNTVIKELYAGLQTELNQTVRPRAYETEGGNNGFAENSANGKLTANTSGASFAFSFLGNGFELYADTHPDYGTARVTIDGVDAGTISLNDRALFNQCVYQSKLLELGEHTVKIVTDAAKPFNISFINVVYGTPVDEEDYPALTKPDGTQDFGDTAVPRLFTREWRTYVKDYKELTSIKFVKDIPAGYKDTYRRIDEYIRIYRGGENSAQLAFVYPGTIVAPTECGSLFAGCEKLTEIVFENFDTSSMRGASSMFNGCVSMTELDLKALKTANVQSMGAMFANCPNLCTLDLSTFELAENANIRNIFENCGGLYSITLPKGIGKDMTSLLPGIYLDTASNAYTYEITQKNAGHKLTLHDEHKFDGAHTHAEIAPTCTTDGRRGYCECTVCHFDFDLEADNELLTEKNRVLPALGHEREQIFGKFPTCTEPGESYQIICSRCGILLEVLDPIPALGHYYVFDTGEGHINGYTVTCDEDGTAKLTVYLTCEMLNADFEKCGHKKEVVIVLDAVSFRAATCTEDAVYTVDTSVREAEIEAALNSEAGKEIDDTVYGLGTIVIRETKTVPGSLGHRYGAPTFVWSDNNTKAKATFVCGREGCAANAAGHTVTVDAVMTHLEQVEATCLANAYTRYTATVTAGDRGETYTQSQISEVNGTIKPHVYTGVYREIDGNKHQRLCINGCEEYGGEEACSAQESWYQNDARTVHYRKCVCGRHMEEGEHGFQVTVNWPSTPAEAEKIGTAELFCPVCKITASGDVIVTAQRVGATCEHGGSIVCTASVAYGGRNFTAAQTYTTERLGHSYVPAENALAWAADGHYATATLQLVCTQCTEAEQNHFRKIGLPATVETDGAVRCGEQAGMTVYTVDPAQKLGTIEAELGDNKFDTEKVKALQPFTHTMENAQIGHIWRLSVLEIDMDNGILTETFRCERCDETIAVEFRGECTVVDATCEHPRQLTFTITEKSIEDVKEAATNSAHPDVTLYGADTFDAIPRLQRSEERGTKLEHEFTEVEAVSPTCTKEGSTAGKKCERCGYTEGVTVIPATQHREQAIPDREATCTTSGAVGGVMCSVCGETLKAQSEVAALGHQEHENSDGELATCTKEGRTNSVYCTRCKQIVRESEIVPAKGHTEHKNGDGQLPTCTADGWTDSVTCTECGEVVRERETLAATGHRWETVPGKAATATEPGLTDGEKCAVCGEVRIGQTEIPPLGEQGLGTGAIVGIVCGAAALIGGGAVVFFFIRKRRGL